MTRSTIRKPKREQVKAWLYMVIVPLIEGLSREEFFLSHNDPSWRFRAKRCEFIRPVREYVEAQQESTLQQFLRFNKNEAELAVSHDTKLAVLENAANAVYYQLKQLPEFVTLAVNIDTADPNWRGAYGRENASNLLAEYTINWATYKDIPSHYLSAKVWKKHGQATLAFRKHKSVKRQFDHLITVLKDLNQITIEFKDSLATVRDNLADNFGLPPDPISNNPIFTEYS